MVSGIKISGQWLRMDPGFAPTLDRHNSAFNPGEILGVFSLDIRIPVKGNERAFKFAHIASLHSDYYIVENVELWIQGVQYTGKLVMNATELEKDEGHFEVDFAGTGFTVDISNTLITDLDLPFWQLGLGMSAALAGAKLACTSADHPFRFPVFRNNDFYEDSENPVLFHDSEGQEIEDPEIYINRYDPANEEFPENYLDLNYYADHPNLSASFNITTLVPFFHILPVLKAITEALGYTAHGDIFSDAFAKSIILSNNRSLERIEDPTKYARAGNYNWNHINERFRVGPQHYSELDADDVSTVQAAIDAYNASLDPGDSFLEIHWTTLNLNDKTTGNFSDIPGLVDLSDETYTYTGTDDLLVRVWVGFKFTATNIETGPRTDPETSITYDSHKFVSLVRIVKEPAGGGADVVLAVKHNEHTNPSEEDGEVHHYEHFALYPIDSATIASGDKIKVEISNFASAPLGDTMLLEPIITHIDIEFFDTTDDMFGVNQIEGKVEMANHIPSMTVTNFLLSAKDLLCLDIIPDHKAKRLTYNLAKNQLTAPALPIDKYVERKAVSRFRHPRKIVFEMAHDGEHQEPPAKSHLTAPDWREEVQPVGTVKFDKRTQEYLKFGFSEWFPNPQAVWAHQGYDPIGRSIGEDGPETNTINPGFRCPKMILAQNYVEQDQEILIPEITEKGTKPSMGITGEKPQLNLLIWHGMQESSLAVAEGEYEYPMASPFRYNLFGAETASLQIRWNDEESLYERYWKEWAEFLLYANGKEIPLVGPKHIIDRYFANRKVSYDNQHYIIEKTSETPHGDVVRALFIMRKIAAKNLTL